jgi:uncharacterized protein YjdB
MRLSHPFLLAVLASTGACSTKIFEVADTTTPVACLVSQVSVSPPQANMNVGERLRATALTRDCPGGPTPAAVRWNSTDTLIARVDSTGLIETRKIGAVSIIATLIADPTVKAAMIVNVSGF